MAVPVSQMFTVATYVLTQKLKGSSGTRSCSCWSPCFGAISRAPAAGKSSIPITSWTSA